MKKFLVLIVAAAAILFSTSSCSFLFEQEDIVVNAVMTCSYAGTSQTYAATNSYNYHRRHLYDSDISEIVNDLAAIARSETKMAFVQAYLDLHYFDENRTPLEEFKVETYLVFWDVPSNAYLFQPAN